MPSRRSQLRRMALVSLAAAVGFVAMPAPSPGQVEAEGLSASFRKASRRALPAVVSIRPQAPAGPIPPIAINPFVPPPPFLGRPVAGGSGVVVDAARGLVLTNDHVLGDGSPVVVAFGDGRERPVRRADRDPKSDLALLTLADPSGLVQADWGDSRATDIGDWVLAIGQPFGLSGTVTAGIVSGKGRGIGVALYEDLIQTDAAINPGNSGGPLVNLRGEIVGINTAIKTAGGGYEGVGFAVPSARARRVASDLAAFGRVRRSYLGINIRKVDPRTAERVGRGDAAMIYGIVQGSPAALAGLRLGDVITGLDGRAIDGTGSLQTAIEVAAIGEPLVLTIDRDGEPRDVTVRPAAQPDRFGLPDPATSPPPSSIAPAPGGVEPPLTTQPVTPTIRREAAVPRAGPRSVELADLGLILVEEGPRTLVVHRVDPDGPADRAGMEVGMRVTDVNGVPVATLDDFLARKIAGAEVRFDVARGAKSGVRTVPLPRPDPPVSLEPIPNRAPARDLPASAPQPGAPRGL